jgi:mRNA-degrading endonuclease HigB of HigAB toxin-antitoxin module
MENIKVKELKEWLETLSYEDFHNPEVIKRGNSIREIELHEMDKSKITLDTVIFFNKPFMVDIDGHIVLGTLTKRKYKVPPFNRAVHFKIEEYLVKNKNSVNGYWMIPERFFKD